MTGDSINRDSEGLSEDCFDVDDEDYDFDDEDYDDDCFECGGEGWIVDDCFEDTCCCADPDAEHGIIPCPHCNPDGSI